MSGLTDDLENIRKLISRGGGTMRTGSPVNNGARVLAASILFLAFLSGCESEDDGDATDLLGGMAAGVGMMAAATGVATGNADLANQGTNLMGQAAAVGSGSYGSTSSSGITSPQNPGVPNSVVAGGIDRNQVAQICKSKSLNGYPPGPQAASEMSSACLTYCAYTATNDTTYYQMYVQAQNNANGLCSASLGKCNNINTNYCHY